MYLPHEDQEFGVAYLGRYTGLRYCVQPEAGVVFPAGWGKFAKFAAGECRTIAPKPGRHPPAPNAPAENDRAIATVLWADL